MTSEERDKRVKLLLLEREKEKRECERSYKSFVQSAWDILEPDNPLVWSWHLDYLCDEIQTQLERIAAREPKKYDLVANVPPRSLKSMLFTRMPTAWAWIKWPWMRFMRGSYAEELAIEHAVETRDIIQSEWYQSNWGDRFAIKLDQNNKSHFRTSRNGACFTFATGSKATGRGANVLSLDDPLSAEQAESETERAKAIRLHKRTLKTRLNNKTVDQLWIIMQRLHEEDLTGYVMAHEGYRFKHICLPAQDAAWVEPKELRKFYVNGYLFPDLFSPEMLQQTKEEDPYMFAGQYQQRPSPEEGGTFKRKNWRLWCYKGMALPAYTITVGLETYTLECVELPDNFDDIICSWDMTFKDKKQSDFVSGHVIGAKGPNKFFIDEYHGRWGFSESVRKVIEAKKKHPNASAILIEDKANGPAIISELKTLIAGIIEVSNNQSKFARAMPMSRQQEAGNIYLPHPAISPWAVQFIEDYANFPNGAYDDRIDSGDQGVNYLSTTKRIWPQYKPELKKLKVPWRELPEYAALMCSEWVDRDLSTSILVGVWDSRNMRLALIDEMEISTPLPEIVKDAMDKKITLATAGAMQNMSKFEWFGNDLMFAKASSFTKSSMMKDGIYDAYSRYGISLTDNNTYDEYGAIMIISRLLLYKSILIDVRCEELRRQMSSWCMEGKDPAQGYGLARALCNMASVLWESGRMEKHEKKLRPYSKEKDNVLAGMDRADNEGRLGEWIQNKGLYDTDDSVNNPNSWMS